MRSKLLFISSVLVFALLSFYSNDNRRMTSDLSVNPPAAKTGAPGEATCLLCHQGSFLSAIGTVEFDFGDTDTTQYLPGQIYDLNIGINSGNKNGFQLTILDGNNQKAGTFINGSNTSTVVAQGREYIRHSASVGMNNWLFQWQAPAMDKGDLRAFYSVNKSNFDNDNTGDLIYIGDDLIPTGTPLSLSNVAVNSIHVNSFWDASVHKLHIEYELVESSNIAVNVQSLNGQLIQSTTIGMQSEGKYHHILDGSSISSGVYIVSVFINNRVFNQKILLN